MSEREGSNGPWMLLITVHGFRDVCKVSSVAWLAALPRWDLVTLAQLKARVRRLLVTVAVVWLCIAAIRGIFAAWAVPRLADYEGQWHEDVVRVRERAEQDPMPNGEPAGGQAVCLYRQLLETLDTDQRATLLSRERVIVDAASAGRVELPSGNQNAASVCAVLCETIETTTPPRAATGTSRSFCGVKAWTTSLRPWLV